jgi:hypothetical protein
MSSASIVLTLIDEALDEVDETITIRMEDPVHAERGAADFYTATIVDNDEFGEWRNSINFLDVTGDGLVTSRDVLVGINELNAKRLIDGLGQLPDRSLYPNSFHYDTSGDGILAPGDLLAIVNELNRQGEGESNHRGSSKCI